MRTEITNLNHCAVPFLSRAAANFAGTTIQFTRSTRVPGVPVRTMYDVHCTYNVHRTMYNVKCTLLLYVVHCTMYIVQCTSYNVQRKVYIVQCTSYNVHCTMYNVKCST